MFHADFSLKITYNFLIAQLMEQTANKTYSSTKKSMVVLIFFTFKTINKRAFEAFRRFSNFLRLHIERNMYLYKIFLYNYILKSF